MSRSHLPCWRFPFLANATVLAVMLLAGTMPVHAAVTVFLDFNSSWVTNLNTASAPFNFTFTSAERAQIEQKILANMEVMYQDFDVDFVTTAPSGDRHRINFGATGSTAFGSAPLDFRNRNPDQTQNMFVANFDDFLESTDTRAEQIEEISRSLSGTAAHELGHSLGLRHHAAYGTPEITPANYSDTGGVQNRHIMATGSTGLNESERETPRTFSTWSNLLLEAALDVTPDPLPLQSEISDAGSDFLSAQSLPLTFKPISGLNAALVEGDLFNESDVDFYSFTSVQPNALFTAEIWSDDLFITSDQFDSLLLLFDTNGQDQIGANVDTFYSGDSFNTGPRREQDSFILNVPLPTPGTYYLSVLSVGNRGGPPGGDYNLIMGVTVPEVPASLLLALTMMPVVTSAVFIRWRRTAI